MVMYSMGNNYKVVEGTSMVHLVRQMMHILMLQQGEWVRQNLVVLHQGGSSELYYLMQQCLVEGSELLGVVVVVNTASRMEVGQLDLVQALRENADLPSAVSFAECQKPGTRRSHSLPSAGPGGTQQSLALGKEWLCRVP